MAAALFSPKYDLKQHPNYRYTAEADKKNAFDLSRLIKHRMDKLAPSEQYTVYEEVFSMQGKPPQSKPPPRPARRVSPAE